MAAASGDDTDIYAFYAEPPQVALNLFHLRNGRIVDRREFFWEDLESFEPGEFFTTLLMQVYAEGQPVPAVIHVPVELEDGALLEELLGEKRGRKVEILSLIHISELERAARRLIQFIRTEMRRRRAA